MSRQQKQKVQFKRRIKVQEDYDKSSDTEVLSDLDDEQELDSQKKTKQQKQIQNESNNKKFDSKKKKYIIEDNGYTFELNQLKRVKVSYFKDKIYINIREHFVNDKGVLLPTKKGISLNIDNWKLLKTFIEDIDDCITKLEQEKK